MNKNLNVLYGFTVNSPDLEWNNVHVIAEVDTDGTDSDGTANNEVIGIDVDEFNCKCIYRANKNSMIYEKNTAIFMSSDGEDLVITLRKLADELEEQCQMIS